jgi:hypothetical protein
VDRGLGEGRGDNQGKWGLGRRFLAFSGGWSGERQASRSGFLMEGRLGIAPQCQCFSGSGIRDGGPGREAQDGSRTRVR